MKSATRPQFAGMRKQSAGYSYIGTPWYAIVEAGHVMHQVHMLPDLRAYAAYKTRGAAITEYWVTLTFVCIDQSEV